jgi:hypothetical protein
MRTVPAWRFAIGDEYDDIGEAAVNAGWRVLERYDVSLLHAIDSVGNRFLVGGDGMGQGVGDRPAL